MIPSIIQELALTSSKIYLEWLQSHGKGSEIITIESILKNDEYSYTFILNKKPYSVDCLCLRIDNDWYYGDSFSVAYYDEKKFKLQIRWLKEKCPLWDVTSEEAKRRIRFSSDMTFLIERVCEWYKKNGTELRIPFTPAFNDENEVKAFLSSRSSISEEQKRAITSALTLPFAYIWGAPGTGKTRYVLAHSILFHLQKDNRVLLIAPTNNALDQSLRGVIQVLRENNIQPEYVFRLGTPTSHFFEDHAECCEDKEKVKIYQKLRSDLEENQKKQTLARQIEYIRYFQDGLQKVSEAFSVQLDLEKQLNDCCDLLKTKRILHEHNIQAIQATQKELEALSIYEKSLGYKLKSKFAVGLREKTVRQKEELIKELSILDKERETLGSVIANLEEQEKSFSNRIAELNLTERIEVIKELAAGINDYTIGDWLTINDFLSEVPNMFRDLQILENSLLENGISDLDFSKLVADEGCIKRQLQSANIGLNQRLTKTKVLAMTLDLYISRYDSLGDDKENPFDFCPNHIFLDEAGYCSLIKGITVLRDDVPVTLLGDHMQLPPVCEMSREDIYNHPRVFMWDQTLLHAEELFKESNVTCFNYYKQFQDPLFYELKKSDLTSTFRFGFKLSKILNHFVYQNGFHSSGTTDDFQIQVVNIKKKEDEIGKTHFNAAEADWIASCINSKSLEVGEDFVVLTPYRKQVEKIRKLLKNHEDKQKIMTIHASQGREWDTVIFSVVDAQDMFFVDIHNPKTKALQLINTATSRSKKKLIIVCDVGYWKTQEDQFINALIV